MIRPACWLYRLYAADDTLLYIGISNRPELRLESHQKHKDWWHEVDTYTTDGYMDRREAEAAEVAAIQAERPLYNVAHNQDRTPERALLRLESISEEAARRGWSREIALPGEAGIEVGPPLAAWLKPMGCHSLAQMQLQVDGYVAAFSITKTGRPKKEALVNLAREALGMLPFEDGICRGPHDGLWGTFWGTWDWTIIERRLTPALVNAFHAAGHAHRLRIRKVPDAFTCKHQRCMFDRYAQRLNAQRDARRRAA